MKNFALHLLVLLIIPSVVFTQSDNSIGKGSDGDAFHCFNYPDPINMRNLNFYLPEPDFSFPCYGFNLEIERSYNSVVYYEDSPFGLGWTFNYGAKVEEKNGILEITESDGFVSEYVREGLQDKYKEEVIKKIITKVKERDKKYEGSEKQKSFYDQMEKKLLMNPQYFESMKSQYIKTSQKVSAGKYVSTSRGTSTLIKKENGFLRTTLSGRMDYFDSSGFLYKMVDRNGNTMKFNYKNGNLAEVIDPCGRKMTIYYNKINKIAKIVDPLNRIYTYKYDEKKRLRRFIDPSGKNKRYFYDDNNRMVKYESEQTSEVITIVYDKPGRVKSTTGPGTKVTTYDKGVDSSNSAHYWVIAKDNEGFWKRVDYHDSEHKVVTTKKDNTKEIIELTPCCGKPLSITDENGKGEFFRYDNDNNLRRRYDSSGNITEYKYEPKWKQISSVKTSDGVQIQYTYDNAGNLSSCKNNKNESLAIAYNKKGKIVSIKNEKNTEVTFEYNYFGKPSTIVKKGYGKLSVEYDELGTVKKVSAQTFKKDGKIKESEIISDIKQSLLSLLSLLKPSGVSLGI